LKKKIFFELLFLEIVWDRPLIVSPGQYLTAERNAKSGRTKFTGAARTRPKTSSRLSGKK